MKDFCMMLIYFFSHLIYFPFHIFFILFFSFSLSHTQVSSPLRYRCSQVSLSILYRCFNSIPLDSFFLFPSLWFIFYFMTTFLDLTEVLVWFGHRCWESCFWCRYDSPDIYCSKCLDWYRVLNLFLFCAHILFSNVFPPLFFLFLSLWAKCWRFSLQHE